MHTQGKWRFYQDKKDSGVLLAPNSAPNAICRITFQGEFKRNTKDNLCLISAVPDLLEACKEASAALEAIVSATVASKEIELKWHHTRNHLTEAIAKAEGK